jgi:hypothetical protein
MHYRTRTSSMLSFFRALRAFKKVGNFWKSFTFLFKSDLEMVQAQHSIHFIMRVRHKKIAPLQFFLWVSWNVTTELPVLHYHYVL